MTTFKFMFRAALMAAFLVAEAHAQAYDQLPLQFEANAGQTDAQL